jgi:phosphohistidine swiveling domain-containing protein
MLSSLPTAPHGVKYALTVPQSVLFADISLRGNRPAAFREVFGVDFALNYIVIDDGAMSWDFTGDARFAQALFGTSEPVASVRRFIAAMGTTARAVERTSWLLASPTTRRPRSVEDVLQDLREYWDAYERHMTSLFTFWNVEELMSESLAHELRDAGRHEDIQSGLQRFLQPSETNYFALERRRLRRLAKRFGGAHDQTDPDIRAALEQHVADFGFLLAPFNLGAPPSVSSLLERLNDPTLTATSDNGHLLDVRPDTLIDLPDRLRELGLLAQELTFWKTERLDVMSLGDARSAGLYRSAAYLLSVPIEQLFAMRRDEIEHSLQAGEPLVSEEIRNERLRGFCLLLHNGEIEFFLPSRQQEAAPEQVSVYQALPGQIRGTAASSGVVSGRVRLLKDVDHIGQLEPGEILVTTMTRPEMGVALDRAAAFVTDEGGRMCHAAIIAREMQKPCVIGTGIATTVLKNGMRVTVDGNTGNVQVEAD